MTIRVAPYHEYKDSGVPWVGKIPTHWVSKPLKHWVQMNAAALPETTAPDYQFNYLDISSVGTAVLTQKPQRLRFSEAPSRARRIVSKGDTIVSTVRTYLKAVYFLAEDTDDSICSTGFAVLTPKSEALPKFVSYLVQSNSFTDQVTANSIGIAYPAIDETRLGSLYVVVPSLSEQSDIVRFLDHADRQIYRLIRAKQKTIKLLEEQKQVTIHRTVTRGSDPDVNLKQSNIEWLGDVPEHWEVLRAKYVLREVDKRSATGSETHLSMSQKLGLIPSSLIEEKRLISESYKGGKLCEKDDIVLNRLKAHLGVFALATEPGVISPDYTVLRAVRPIMPRYFEFVLRTPACRVELRKRAKGIVQGFWRLYTDDFYEIVLPVPPLQEQELIVNALDQQLKQTNAAIDRATREINLLREYRTRLISDVVTGKLDVQGVELPELKEEDALEKIAYDEVAEAKEIEEDIMKGSDT